MIVGHRSAHVHVLHTFYSEDNYALCMNCKTILKVVSVISSVSSLTCACSTIMKAII